MKTVKLIVIIALSLSLIILVIQNTETVESRFLWITVEMPVFTLLFLTAVVGLILGVVLTLFIQRNKKR